LLEQQLKANGYETLLISFPNYDSITGRAIKDHLMGKWECTVPNLSQDPFHNDASEHDALAFQALMSMDKYAMAPTIQAALTSGAIVICDRYWLSAVAYGGGDGIDEKLLIEVHASLPQPDVQFYIDITPEESVKRQVSRGRERDRYEKQAGFMAKARDNYLRIFTNTKPLRDVTDYVMIDGMRPIEKIHDEIMDVVERKL
jgi:dTMP kinase